MNCNRCGVDVTTLEQFKHDNKTYCEHCYHKYVLKKPKATSDSWNPDQCVRDDQKELFKNLFTTKVEVLEDELKNEKKIFEDTGFHSSRDIEEIEKELEVAKTVLKNIDNLPKCK